MHTTYDKNRYNYDRNNKDHRASIQDGAILYRLTSIHHCSQSDVLTGRGTDKCRAAGRFHGPQQRTSYCTNNVLTCISEILFHNYKQVLIRIEDDQPYHDVLNSVEDRRCLAVFTVTAIDDLVYLDTEGVKVDFGGRYAGTMIVNPDPIYEPFRSLSDTLRTQKKRGVIYPSARHSRDLCFAFFEDESGSIRPDFFEIIIVNLKLVPENQNPKVSPTNCDPYCEKLHSTMGYYEFQDESQLEKLKKSGVFYPKDLPPKGMVDFVRRKYIDYPQNAVLF